MVEGDVEGLDAKRVAGEHDAPLARVPDREGEHPVEAVDHGGAEVFVEVDEHLGVGVRAEGVAPFEFAAERAEVVDLAVEGDPDGPVLVGHGLVPGGRQVEDGEPPVREADGAVDVHARVVGAAVPDGVGHRAEEVGGGVTAGVTEDEAGDATHAVVGTGA